VLGRGIAVSASVAIPEAVLNNLLKTSSESLYEYYRIVSKMSERTNTLGFHIGVANILAAVFASTGQDVGCVHESCVANEEIVLNNGPEKGILYSIYMPSLILGTVGGGTHLPTQKECLGIMGCTGAGNVKKLAEIIASFCIAMDLSTFSALDSGEFSGAHEALGSKKNYNAK
jgi:hydroxymethylglutaryl-CoA reductase (NADPH)